MDNLTAFVKEIIAHHEKMSMLTGEIISTLLLPNNQKHFIPEFLLIANRWKEHYELILHGMCVTTKIDEGNIDRLRAEWIKQYKGVGSVDNK